MSARRDNRKWAISKSVSLENTRSARALVGVVVLVAITLVGGLWPASAAHGGAVAPAPSKAVSSASSGRPLYSAFLEQKGLREEGSQSESPVNPYLIYGKEPAPMGIADFGVFPGVSPYAYLTPEFVGTVNISGFTTWNSSLPSHPGRPADYASLQLNAEFVFGDAAGNAYVFWTQTVAYIDTESNQITDFRIDVFNDSSPNAQITREAVCSGPACSPSDCYWHGTGGDCDLPEHVSYVGQPIVLELLSKVVNETPVVSFAIDGDVYANMTFSWGNSTQFTPMFGVNGTVRDPTGLYFDAELIIGGPGGGSKTIATGGSMTMQLQYLNGSTLQNVPHAYNFGTDTAECISGVTDSGSGTATLTAGANGTLGPLGAPSPPSPSFDWLIPLVVVVVATIGVVGLVEVRRRRRLVYPAYPVPYPAPFPGTVYPPLPPGMAYPAPPPGTAYPPPPPGMAYPAPPPGAAHPAPSASSYPSAQPLPQSSQAPGTYGSVSPQPSVPPPPGAGVPPLASLPPNQPGTATAGPIPVPRAAPIAAPPHLKLCRSCGRPLDTDARFCAFCGIPAGG